MSSDRVDRTSSLLSARLTRRDGLREGSALALSPAAVTPGHAIAQVATPAVVDDTATAFLFVQTFATGTISPKEDEVGAYLLELTGVSAQTIYFSDRPQRIVGAVPTAAFLAGLGFTPADPPNAALIAQTPGGEDVVVVELFDPVYSEAADGVPAKLSYEIRVLADYDSAGLALFAARQVDEVPPASFGPASLFIDDCSDQSITCCAIVAYHDGAAYCADAAGTIGPIGFCWHFGDVCCHPCENDDQGYWDDQCGQQFPTCGENCTAFLGGSCW
jgi:hypothetical protein